MDTLEAIRSRRSVKQYDPDHVMPDADKQALLELAMLSPTSFNLQHWRFVCVEDPMLRQKMKDAAWGQTQVTDASLLVVLCADLSAWERPDEVLFNVPAEARARLDPAIHGVYNEQPEMQRDEALRSVGIAAQTLMLAARAMGYDSCPMIGFDPRRVAGLIHLPDHHIIGMLVTIGKAAAPARARSGQLAYQRVVFTDHFPE